MHQTELKNNPSINRLKRRNSGDEAGKEIKTECENVEFCILDRLGIQMTKLTFTPSYYKFRVCVSVCSKMMNGKQRKREKNRNYLYCKLCLYNGVAKGFRFFQDFLFPG